MIVRFPRATTEHVAYLAPRLRQSDRDEIAAMADIDPEDALWQSYYNSNMRWAITCDEETVAIFGCGATENDRLGGVPWLLGSDDMPKAAKAIARNSKRFIDYMLRQYGTLYNFVDVRNTTSIKWLRWCGFTLYDPVSMGPRGHLFHPFLMMSEKMLCASSISLLG